MDIVRNGWFWLVIDKSGKTVYKAETYAQAYFFARDYAKSP